MAYTTRAHGSVSAMSTSSNPVVRGGAFRVPYQEQKFPCNKEGCQHIFSSLEAMKLHKKHDPDHFYCKRCDFDAEDWEDLTSHKVENMAPYLEGVAGSVKPLDEDLKHIACEFCGEDFKSFGGRKRHRQQAHPADQDITCPGCQGKFIRASHLIEHLEKGNCDIIPARLFHSHLQQKYIVGQIMSRPDKAFQAPKLLKGRPPSSIFGTITDGGESLDQDAGGVSLMDQQDEAQMNGYKPLRAEKNPIDLHVQPNRQPWPLLPSSSSAQLTGSMRSMSIGPTSTSRGKKRAGGVSLGDFEQPREGGEANTESYSYLGSSEAASIIEDDDDDTASEYTATAASATGGAGAWETSQTSRALFPTAKATPKVQPKAGDWDAILAQRVAEAESNTGADMLKIAWWDPSSKDYDISRFRHPVHEAYFCPFPACEDAMYGNSFDSQADIESHIKYCHTRTKFRCEECYKHFASAASLVAHAESTRRCGIKSSGRFGKFLDDITGGFLKSKYVGELKIYRTEKALVRAGQPSGGIMSTQFTAKDPHAV